MEVHKWLVVSAGDEAGEKQLAAETVIDVHDKREYQQD